MPFYFRHVARGGKGVCSPRSKLVPLKKTQKMKPPCYCWQYRPQTQPIIDQATDLTVCKIGSLIVYRVCGSDCSIESRVDTFTFNYTHARHPLFSLDRVPSVYNIVCNTCTVYLHSTHSRHGWSGV